MFVLSLFAPESVAERNPWEAMPLILQEPMMLIAAVALLLMQLVDWLRDLREGG